MKFFNKLYLWIMDLMKGQSPRRTSDAETVNVLRLQKFYKQVAKEKK